MGIPLYRARSAPKAGKTGFEMAQEAPLADSSGEEAVPDHTHSADGQGVGSLDTLRGEVAECTACPLHASRTQTVFGVGDPQGSVMFVGEAPGAEEDRLGEPFVGRGGKLLDAMLAAIGLDRNAMAGKAPGAGDQPGGGGGSGVFIANVLKCRPPKNRDPDPEEVAQCEGYLRRQIELVAPDVLVALGRVAAQELTRSKEPLGKLRGREHRYHETPLLITYHPAYLLRNPADKAKAWADLKAVRRRIHAG
ncbi:MAG: uracil-DNA glycosylase family protein [Thiohalorhabdaceae bacterium]